MTVFMQVANFNNEVRDGAKWWRNKVYGRWEPVVKTNEKFTLKDAVAMFSREDKFFYMTKKKESPGQVEFATLDEKFKEIFRKARDKEIKSLLDSGAIKILSLEESRQFRQQHPDHVLTSRYYGSVEAYRRFVGPAGELRPKSL